MDENELAKYPGLYQRGGVWYVRKKVPIDLRHLNNSDQVRKSLDASDFKAAVRLYPARMAEITHRFEQQRADLGRQDRVTQALLTAKLDRLSRAEIDGLVWAWWEKRAAARRPGEDAVDLDEALACIDGDLNDLNSPDGDPAEQLAGQLLVEAGLSSYPRRVGPIMTATRSPAMDRSTEQFRYLRDRVRAGLEIEARLARDHLTGEHTAPKDPQFNPASGSAVRSGVGGDERRLSDLIKDYRAERVALYGDESTSRKYGLLFRVLDEVLGEDLPVASIRRDHCVQVLAFLQALPPNATKKFPKLSLREAMEKAQREGLRGMAPKTVGTYMNNLTAILNWAEAGGWPCKANTKGLVRSREALVRRRGFEPDELARVFAGLQDVRGSQPTRFWVPALALYTGARAGEICQLRGEDVVEIGGVPCLNLTVFDAEGRRVADKRLKTASSERYVPLHPDLINAGFRGFAEAGQPTARLFSDLKPGPGGKYSHSLSKWFGDYLDQIGLSDRSLVFHSFRHGFRDACRDADIAEETALALGGWTGIDQATRYGDRGRVPILNRAIEKLSYGKFSLPRL